ncbi:hypothetical protein K1W69_19370 [Hoeflea sp. WL0058]|uniref:Uncharacterized protein n=1 Tax=Flavimaribacter sediminis TaxID=2865987 RepID=A0AAE2ZMI7_9HYPH|nr:hypothetical protein [Flavimaribacter sediminis]MBW8639363.1 hypothetical protein [Flavimaribacter sediminis]
MSNSHLSLRLSPARNAGIWHSLPGRFGLLLGLLVCVAIASSAKASSERANELNAKFEKAARAAMSATFGAQHPICNPSFSRATERSKGRVNWFVIYRCSRDEGRKSHSVTVTAKMNAFTYDHPTIAMKNWDDFKIRSLDKRKSTDWRRTDWREEDTFVAQIKQRWIRSNLQTRSDYSAAWVTAEAKKKFLGYQSDNRRLSDPQAVRVHIEVKFNHNDIDSVKPAAPEVAYSIARLIINDLVNEQGGDQPCKNRDLAELKKIERSAVQLYITACAKNFRLSRTITFPYVDLALYLKDEDGNVPVLRTGYEVELYKRIKRSLVNRETANPISPVGLFYTTINAMLKKDRGRDQEKRVTVNLFEAQLTALNVTRLLARPEQWAGEYPRTYAGQDRRKADLAKPMLEDILGIQSVDRYPSFARYIGIRSFDVTAIDDPFFGPDGVFVFHEAARAANDGFGPEHWNGGIHYYYWTGALGHWLGNHSTLQGGGLAGVVGASIYEYLQKLLGGNPERSIVQLGNGFQPGAKFASRLQSQYEAIAQFDENMVSD